LKEILVREGKRIFRHSNYSVLCYKMRQKYKEIDNTIKKLYQSLSKNKDIISNDTVYIFGNGPSLHKIKNKKFFEKQMCFGINYSYEIIPYMNHIFVGEIETFNKILTKVDSKKLILPLGMNYHKTSFREIIIHPEAYYYKIQNPTERLETRKISLEKDAEIFCYSTTTHSAIHIAAYMGAKNIVLIGVDYKNYPNGKVHFESKDGGEDYSNQNWGALGKHRKGDRWITYVLETQGIKVNNISFTI